MKSSTTRRSDKMEVVRVKEEWQRAGVYYIRAHEWLDEEKNKNKPAHLDGEFKDDKVDSKYVLALDVGKPLGTLRINLYEGHAKLERVCVLDSARGKGVGKKIVEEAEKWIKELGFNSIWVTSRDTAVGFYESLGYVLDPTFKEERPAGHMQIKLLKKEI